jgi:hypothetical protein
MCVLNITNIQNMEERGRKHTVLNVELQFSILILSLAE